MLKRKIESYMKSWKEQSDRNPLVIKGCRQCGKTFMALDFARKHYTNVAYVNFMQDARYNIPFKESLQIDDIIAKLSTLIRDCRFEPYNTCIIFDEIQECMEARASLKFFKMDGRYDVIATGSLLGVKGYRNQDAPLASIPVGYETIVTMYPLDFEEFLWANGISKKTITLLKEHLQDETPIPESYHQTFRDLLLKYVVVGGMPAVVNTFISTHDMGNVLELQRRIVDEYEDDMIKYAPKAFQSRIRECFESIPAQLSKENKKFQYSIIKKGAKASHYAGSLQWIEDAGIICRCKNLSIPELPLNGNAVNDSYKIYMCDTGLFVSMLDEGTQFDVLNGNLYGYKGAIFENLVADIFNKMGRKLYYYHKDSGLEVDFVIRRHGNATLIEVKSTSGNVKSTKTILNHPEKYHVYHAIKLGDYNIGRNDKVLTLPIYMAFLLNEV